MSNKIVEKYFEHCCNSNQWQKTIEQIFVKTNFTPEKEIFRGQIYDHDKIGSIIYKGTWCKKTVALKIQLLKLDISEVDIINKFNNQNTSKKIRLPKIYDSQKWNQKNGYAYFITEYIKASQIYTPPLANDQQIKEFCNLYQEYKTKAVKKSFFKKELIEQSSMLFVSQRIAHWTKIAQSKKNLNKIEIKNIEKFLSLASKHLPAIKMEFMHGHLTYSDIFKVAKNKYVLMSNLYWSYRPQWYDTTFHLWASILDTSDLSITTKQWQEYLQKWLKYYKQTPVIQTDPTFEQKFNLIMAERLLGSLLVDIPNKNYSTKITKHLTDLNRGLFDYFTSKL